MERICYLVEVCVMFYHMFARIGRCIVFVERWVSAGVVDHLTRVDIGQCVRYNVTLIASRFLTLYRVFSLCSSYEIFVRYRCEVFGASRAFTFVGMTRNGICLINVVARCSGERGHRRNQGIPTRPSILQF